MQFVFVIPTAGPNSGAKEDPIMAILDTLHLGDLRHPGLPRLSARLASLAAMLEAARTRRCLARLDDRMLQDIGLSRTDALAEAERAPWDLGPPRRR
jgi:uncharacterized protein YjiS (DUF1127 family)